MLRVGPGWLEARKLWHRHLSSSYAFPRVLRTIRHPGSGDDGCNPSTRESEWRVSDWRRKLRPLNHRIKAIKHKGYNCGRANSMMEQPQAARESYVRDDFAPRYVQ